MKNLTPFIMLERASFLSTIKLSEKKGNRNFDVTMGALDGAEIAEIVCLYLLQQLSINVFEKSMFGLYRDDGLAVTRGPDRANKVHMKPLLTIWCG